MQGSQRHGSQLSYPLGSVTGMERSTALLCLGWFEWHSQICGANMSRSSCLSSLMCGGWKATHYLRVGGPLLHFLPLKTVFKNVFHTESPEHKAKGQDGSQRHHGLAAVPCSGSLLASILMKDQSGGLEEAQADQG